MVLVARCFLDVDVISRRAFCHPTSLSGVSRARGRVTLEVAGTNRHAFTRRGRGCVLGTKRRAELRLDV